MFRRNEGKYEFPGLLSNTKVFKSLAPGDRAGTGEELPLHSLGKQGHRMHPPVPKSYEKVGLEAPRVRKKCLQHLGEGKDPTGPGSSAGGARKQDTEVRRSEAEPPSSHLNLLNPLSC